MLNRCCDWLDDRTGYRQCFAQQAERRLPGGPSWGHALGVSLVWLGGVVLVTGMLLMTSYSASTNNAWASIHFIESTPGGSFLRGLHYFGGQAMIILFALYMFRALLMASYRAPRELAWIAGLILLPLLVVSSLTGSLMTGSLTSQGQVTVEGNILGSLPVVGDSMKRVLLGGGEMGNLTLTHLQFAHVILLPLVVGLLVWFHIAQLRRSAKQAAVTDNESDAVPYRPAQSIRNLVVFALAFGATCTAACMIGAPLDAPADPELASHLDPRPEWYFTFLFKLRFFFTGANEAIFTMAVPKTMLFLLMILPWLDRWLPKAMGAGLRVTLALVCVGGWTALTFASLYDDSKDDEFLHKSHLAESWAERAKVLADHQPIPPRGAGELLRRDAKTYGPILYAQHCASCHPYFDFSANPDGAAKPLHGIVTTDPSAPNLYGFATPDWIAGFLNPESIQGIHYFGKTEFGEGDMVDWVIENIGDVDEEDKEEVLAEAKLVARALSAEAQLPHQATLDQKDQEKITEGRMLLVDSFACTDCHKFGDEGDLGDAPDLTGYGSRQWLIDFIASPEHERFYGENNDRMPAFAANPDAPEENQLDQRSIELIADWLRRDWFEPPASKEETAPEPASKPSETSPEPEAESSDTESAKAKSSDAEPVPMNGEPAPAEAQPES